MVRARGGPENSGRAVANAPLTREGCRYPSRSIGWRPDSAARIDRSTGEPSREVLVKRRFSRAILFLVTSLAIAPGLLAQAPPSISAAFNPGGIQPNGVSTMTFTITNPDGVNAQNGVAFSTALPANLVVATPNGLGNTCGGTATATAGSGSITLVGGTIAAGGSC